MRIGEASNPGPAGFVFLNIGRQNDSAPQSDDELDELTQETTEAEQGVPVDLLDDLSPRPSLCDTSDDDEGSIHQDSCDSEEDENDTPAYHHRPCWDWGLEEPQIEQWKIAEVKGKCAHNDAAAARRQNAANTKTERRPSVATTPSGMFTPANQYTGPHEGYHFGTGEQGTGYYGKRCDQQK